MNHGFFRSGRLVRYVGVTFLILALFLTVRGGLAVRSLASKCSVCLRGVDTRMVYRIVMADGTSKKVCCPRCCESLQMQTGAKVVSAWATDFETGKEIDAALAFYVSGSDLTPCCTKPPFRVDENKIHYFRVWDHCLPSLIAFERKQSAVSFQRQHGGEVQTYDSMQVKRP